MGFGEKFIPTESRSTILFSSDKMTLKQKSQTVLLSKEQMQFGQSSFPQKVVEPFCSQVTK
jgi:hypothetical protein